MRSIFDADGPLLRALSQISDLVILNLLTLLCCVPVVTAGAAFAAMHYVIIRMHEGTEGSITRQFFREFKGNLKKAGASWFLIIAVCFILYMDYHAVNSFMTEHTAMWRGFVYAGALILASWTMYVFPLHARFENTIRGTWKNAAILMVAFVPRTLGMLAIEAAALFAFTQVAALLPLLFLCGFTLPGFLRGYLYIPVFKRIENQAGGEESSVEEETDSSGEEDGAGGQD